MPDAEFGLYSLYRENMTSAPQVRLWRPAIHCQECRNSILVRENVAGFAPVLRLRPLVPLIARFTSFDCGWMATPRSAIVFENGIVRTPTSRVIVICESETRFDLAT